MRQRHNDSHSAMLPSRTPSPSTSAPPTAMRVRSLRFLLFGASPSSPARQSVNLQTASATTGSNRRITGRHADKNYSTTTTTKKNDRWVSGHFSNKVLISESVCCSSCELILHDLRDADQPRGMIYYICLATT